MLGPDAERLLLIIGKDPKPPGILEVDDMPAALIALENAVIADEQQQVLATEHSELEKDDAKGKHTDQVALRQRAWPLIELIRQAYAAKQVVVWGV